MLILKKNQAVDLAIEQISKNNLAVINYEIRTGTNCSHRLYLYRCPTLDLALGVGGIPKGRIIEIFGPEAAGKTTVCLSIVAELKKPEEQSLLLTLNMRLIQLGQKYWESSLMTY